MDIEFSGFISTGAMVRDGHKGVQTLIHLKMCNGLDGHMILGVFFNSYAWIHQTNWHKSKLALTANNF